MLGLGGVRALHALGIEPAVWHLNEGHAAFVVLQRIRDAHRAGRDASTQALAEVRRTTVFTTHTPVPAGHDAFPFHLVETHLAGAWGSLGDHRDQFLALGAYDNGSGTHVQHDGARACARPARVNAVSQLHGDVTRADVDADLAGHAGRSELPIQAVTNGVHVPHVDRRRSWPSCSTATSAPTGASARSTSQILGRDRSTSRTRSCGPSGRRCAADLFAFIRERARDALDRRTRQRRARSSPPARCSTRRR